MQSCAGLEAENAELKRLLAEALIDDTGRLPPLHILLRREGREPEAGACTKEQLCIPLETMGSSTFHLDRPIYRHR